MILFPTKIATGISFCNRQLELEILKKNADLCQHTIIYSPRRYGKSSLVYKVISDLDIPSATIDFFLAHDEKIITKRLMEGISSIISQLEKPSQKFFHFLQETMKNFKISMTYSGFTIESIITNEGFDGVDQIFVALTLLDKLAKERNKKILIFLDEFQDISAAKNSKSIQGAIRHVAQTTQNITFFFSGSYQHMLAELFDDKSKPLYMLCDKLYLKRILSNEYIIHFNKFAKQRWGQDLSTDVIHRILKLTEAHAFYVNILCNKLFNSDIIPLYDDVSKAWELCYENESRRLISELENLSINQQDILRAVAMKSPINPQSAEFSIFSEKSTPTIRQCIKVLMEKDFIYKATHIDPYLDHIQLNQYRVLDPLLRYYLIKLS